MLRQIMTHISYRITVYICKSESWVMRDLVTDDEIVNLKVVDSVNSQTNY